MPPPPPVFPPPAPPGARAVACSALASSMFQCAPRTAAVFGALAAIEAPPPPIMGTTPSGRHTAEFVADRGRLSLGGAGRAGARGAGSDDILVGSETMRRAQARINTLAPRLPAASRDCTERGLQAPRRSLAQSGHEHAALPCQRGLLLRPERAGRALLRQLGDVRRRRRAEAAHCPLACTEALCCGAHRSQPGSGGRPMPAGAVGLGARHVSAPGIAAPLAHHSPCLFCAFPLGPVRRRSFMYDYNVLVTRLEPPIVEKLGQLPVMYSHNRRDA